MHEINVTPFVDVMLVLLDRLHGDGAAAAVGRARRPAGSKGQSLNLNKDPLTVTVDRTGKIFLGSSEESLDVPQLIVKLKATPRAARTIRCCSAAIGNSCYGRVSEVISAVREGGFQKFTFVSGPEDIEQGPGPAGRR